jgi:hypothetical protein
LFPFINKVVETKPDAMKKLLLATLMIFAALFYLRAQSISPEVIAAAGDYFSNGTVSISWTLGEIATETIGNGTIILTQGFQQPNYGVVSVPKWSDKRFEIKAFPNPARDFLKIQVNGNENTDLIIEMYDAIGRKLYIQKMEAGTTMYEIDVATFVPGMYYLKFSDDKGHVVQTYQISKLIK